MDAAAAKKLLKKQERLKKKAKAAARKQSKQETTAANAGGEAPPPATKKPKTHAGPKPPPASAAKPKEAGFEYQGSEKFLTPAHPQFAKLLAASYQGFVHEPAATIDPAFHRAAKKAFETLRDKSYFQYDVVMAGGKNLSRTFVRRTLVGEPGITYKYLGLRIFAHSWSGPQAAPWFKQVRALNADMTARTQRAMEKATNALGSCAYNLTLINYMEPLSNWDLGLKDDETYGLGKTSVSWHADSSLQDFSAIGVYNCMLDDPQQKNKKNKAGGKKRKAQAEPDEPERDWRIALRLAPETTTSEPAGKTKKRAKPGFVLAADVAKKSIKAPPAVSMATRDGDAYYLLGDFNHDHQHMVLTGSSVRVSTTHRVAVESDSTLASILARLEAAYDLSGVPLVEGREDDRVRLLTPQQVLKEQSALTELEMEWIRQYWIQGKQHDVLHVDWQKPMRELEATHWRRLELRTKLCLDLVLDNDDDSHSVEDAQGERWQLSDRLKIVNVLLQELAQRQKRRGLFRQRIQDKAYRRIASEFQPVERPRFDAASALPFDLAPQLQALEALKSELKRAK